MPMKIARPVAIVLAATLLLSQNVHAAQESSHLHILPFAFEITPMWVNTNDVKLELGFANGSAQCTGRVTGNIGTSKITATFILERKNSNGTYSFEKSWSESVNGRTLTFSDTYAVTKGYTYRLSVTATVTKDEVTETISTNVESRF